MSLQPHSRQYASRVLYPIRETPSPLRGDTLEAAATWRCHRLGRSQRAFLDMKVGKHKIPLDAAGGLTLAPAGVFLPVPPLPSVELADRLHGRIASHPV